MKIGFLAGFEGKSQLVRLLAQTGGITDRALHRVGKTKRPRRQEIKQLLMELIDWIQVLEISILILSKSSDGVQDRLEISIHENLWKFAGVDKT